MQKIRVSNATKKKGEEMRGNGSIWGEGLGRHLKKKKKKQLRMNLKRFGTYLETTGGKEE